MQKFAAASAARFDLASTLKPLFLAACLVSSVAAPVLAADTSQDSQSDGNEALALAARVGAVSPTLSRSEKIVLADFLNGRAHHAGVSAEHAFDVRADRVQCRLGNVDITEHDCTLSFGAKTVTMRGRNAQALNATLAEIGVESDGAMGSIYRAIDRLSCTVDPKAVEGGDGSGAHCSYAGDPGVTRQNR